MSEKFVSTFDYKLIYVFRINDGKHKNMLKVGETTLHTNEKFDQFFPNCHKLNEAARERINNYTTTAGIIYELLYTEIAVFNEVDEEGIERLKSFNDHAVHSVLKRSGIENVYFDTEKKQNEWFKTDLPTVKKAICAVKNNKKSLKSSDISHDKNPIIFRPEQLKAINDTIRQFRINNHMLWNAKMRFGKTLTALQVVKEMKFRKTIIITHRPVVDDGWFNDFKKIFYEQNNEYSYGSKSHGMSLKDLIATKKPFVYFASIQDLRGSFDIGGKFVKNDEVFRMQWDFVVTDEAHEGTQTDLGKKVRESLITNKNKELSLSGTPFNLFDLYSNDSTFTWDYIMEQQAKNEWMKDPNKLGDPNPYEDLPKLNIFTYHLEKLLPNLDDKAFTFKEMFRTWTGDINVDFVAMPSYASIGDFVHEDYIKAFLDLLCKKSDETNYPFSTEEYRSFFRHTLWMVPGVKEAKALCKLLRSHSVFGSGLFRIVNVAGNGDDEYKEEQKALKKLKKAMGTKPEETYTITLSCGRLTTGVTIKEWTGVLMMSGSYMTDAKQYLQTIFRAQTPANINGKMKENCYVFDFAPDRTLRVIYDAVKKMGAKRIPAIDTEKLMGAFLNFCPVISLEVSHMYEFKAEQLLQEVKRVYTERVVDSGFEDSILYNDELLKLNGIDLEKFDKLQKIIGKTKQTKKPDSVNVVENNLTDEEREELDRLKKKAKDELLEEDKIRLEELKKIKKLKNTAVSILRGISIRIPLLVYGLDKDYDFDITIDDFADMIDEVSWREFMPVGVTKEIFKDFIKYYDKDIFVASCRKIRTISKQCDNLEPTERIKQLVMLFNKFKNPDKETVLTPWNVVNMHMSETIGGFDFFDIKHDKNKMLDEPRFINVDICTKEVFNSNSNILEINSKTGLYPLYVAYSIYRSEINKIDSKEITDNKKLMVWDKIVENNVFIICKTEMAKMITKRTLAGYRNVRINSHAFDDLIMQMRDKPEKFVQKIQKASFWNKGGNENMKFNAVVGNPPYQGTNHQQIYPYFYLTSIAIGENVSLIFPIGWQEPKNGNNLSKLNNNAVKKDKEIVFIDNRQNVFPGITGAERTNVILRKKGYDNGLNGDQFIYINGANPSSVKLLCDPAEIKKPDEIMELNNIIQKSKKFVSMQLITSGRKPYGIATNVFKDNLIPYFDKRNSDSDYLIYGNNGLIKFIPVSFKIPKSNTSIKKFKVFVAYAWGNMSEGSGLGGAYSDVIIASPNEICTETYLQTGCFDDFESAKKHSKYLLTKFARALLYVNKTSQHSTTAWGAVPVQDYSEEWWDKSIEEIDEELFNKYNVSQNIRDFVKKNFQTRTIANIVNYK